MTFAMPWLTLNKQDDWIGAGDNPASDHFVKPMQLIHPEFKPIAPNRSSALREVQQPDLNVIVPAGSFDCSVDRVVQLLPLNGVLAQESRYRPTPHRYWRNHVEPAKSRQPGCYFMAQGER